MRAVRDRPGRWIPSQHKGFGGASELLRGLLEQYDMLAIRCRHRPNAPCAVCDARSFLGLSRPASW